MSKLHAESIVIDACAPLLIHKKYVDEFMKGGVTAVAPTVGGSKGASETIKELGAWLRFIRERSDLILVRSATDIDEAKKENKLGIVLHFQGSSPIETNLDFIDLYKTLGVGIIQLAYNESNPIGDGCEVAIDKGLSKFGLDVIRRMNDARVIVDCSHTGHRTTLDAIAASSSPVIISHANPRAVYSNGRNIPDDLIKAIAENGGVVGACASTHFVADGQATFDQFVGHIDYMVQLVGADHVGLGLDYYITMDPYCDLKSAQATYDEHVNAGRWSVQNYRPPPYKRPIGIETPDKLGNLTEGLERRGYKQSDIKKIMGGNWHRVYKIVWNEQISDGLS